MPHCKSVNIQCMSILDLGFIHLSPSEMPGFVVLIISDFLLVQISFLNGFFPPYVKA
jgi:hypothetical protein